MLDTSMIEQLKGVFSALSHPVGLRLYASPHADRTELREMLLDLTRASDKIVLEEVGDTIAAPGFALTYAGRPNGVSFRGIPGGHEFSSLVLSILYADGKGKQPDAGILHAFAT